MKAYVIGDSHTNFFSGNEQLCFQGIPNIRESINICKPNTKEFMIFHLGPVLAYSTSRYLTKTRGREKSEFLFKTGLIAPKMPVICSFGEIDVRMKVLKYAQKNHCAYSTVVDEIISHYLSFLDFININNEAIVWGPIATQKDESDIDTNFLRTGTENERNIITAYFNEKLKEKCKEHNIKFASIFYDLIDENYRTKNEYYADGVHLSQRAWKFASKKLDL